MAKKRKFAKTRTIVKKVRAKAKSKQLKPESIVLPSVAYGAVRSKVSNALKPFTNKIPLGTIADEAILGVGGYMLAKKAKNKMAKQAGMAILAVESARVGEALMDGSAFGSSITTTSSGYPV